MSLPLPNLDDRRFQDLVDEAKRMVQQRCADWTDHNVSDPGVTLIETFAFMVDELVYRLNRVPDRLYLTYLDLLGVRLHPPTAAACELTMWLSAGRSEPVVVPAGTEAGTRRTEVDETVVFATTRELVIPPRRLAHIMTAAAGKPPVLGDETLAGESRLRCFSPKPQLGDCVLFGLDDPAPHCAIAIKLTCDVEGVGVNPEHPPWVWEAWSGEAWTTCEVDHDATGGFNRPGDVVVHLPATHTASVIERVRAGWLRCRAVEPAKGYAFYSASPTIRRAEAYTIGATVPAVHAETVVDEVLGMSEGISAQTFSVAKVPVVSGSGEVELEVAAGTGWEQWREVDTFADCGPEDRVFRLDRTTGEVSFAPAVREPDGTLRLYGSVPPKGAPVRIPRYRTGGGPRGNVAVRAVSVLRTTLPPVDRVENRRPGTGGVAGETVEEAKVRGPLVLRTQDRAVAAEDYEELAHRAAPGLSRVRCVAAESSNGDPSAAGGVRVLLVPTVSPDEAGVLHFEHLVPPPDLLRTVSEYLEPRRPVGARVSVEPPYYQGVTVIAHIIASPRTSAAALEEAAVRALRLYFDPLGGGPDEDGWPFGRAAHVGEAYTVLQGLSGAALVEDVKLFPADPITGRRGEQTQRVDLRPNALVFSFDHQVRVSGGE